MAGIVERLGGNHHPCDRRYLNRGRIIETAGNLIDYAGAFFDLLARGITDLDSDLFHGKVIKSIHMDRVTRLPRVIGG